MATTPIRHVGSRNGTDFEAGPSSSTDLWAPAPQVYKTSAGQALALARAEGLARAVEEAGFDVDMAKLEESRDYIERAYSATYADALKGGPAFIVPSRLSATNLNALPEAYTTIMPFLDTIAEEKTNLNVVKAMGMKIMRLLEAMPPFVVDIYDDFPGGIVFAPITAQTIEDYPSRYDGLRVVRDIANDATEFAVKNDARIIGLGAIIPSLTNYGKTITKEHEIAVTTGHAGTAWLVGEQVGAIIADDPSSRITILGNGAIGSALTTYIHSKYPGNRVQLHDSDIARSHQLAESIDSSNVQVNESIVSAISSSDVVVSAVTGPIDLDHIPGLKSLKGVHIIDDSQPAAFDREQVLERGGTLSWVVGSAEFLQGTLKWSYAGSIVSGKERPSTAIFGCEAEAAVIVRAAMDGILPHEFAVSGRAVRAEDILKVGGLFTRYGVQLAPSQSYGILN